MKLINKKRILIFLLSLIIPAGYFISWYVFKWFHLGWHTRYNVPGFLLVGGSWPWSWPSLYYMEKLGSVLGHKGRDILNVIVVCLGFAFNMTLVICLIGTLLTLKKRSTP